MTLPPPFRIALAQMRVTPGDVKGNVLRGRALIRRAAAEGAQVIVLPEAMDCGWTHPRARELATPIPGATYVQVGSLALDLGVYVCFGMTERRGDRVYNAAVLVSPTGDLLLHHRKLNELDIAHDLYDQGNHLGTTRTPLATFGLMICADGFATGQVVSRALGLMGADVILSPGAWAVPADHDNAASPYGQEWRDCYVPVAREHGLWIIGVSSVGPITGGPWAGRRCIGCSLVIGPDGREVLQGPYGEEAEAVLYVDIEPRRRNVRGSAWNHHRLLD
jgi:predicted amidohydrolase